MSLVTWRSVSRRELSRPASDGEHGRGEVLGCQVPDLFAFTEHRSVEPGGAVERRGPRVGAGELVDVLIGERIGGRTQGGQGVFGEECALPPGEKHVRDAGGGENTDVPGATVSDVGEPFDAEPGQPGLDRRVASHAVGVRGGDTERGGTADVLARQVDGSDVEPGDQLAQVFGRGRAVVLRRGGGGVAEAAQVWGEDAVVPAEQGDQLVEDPPGFRKAVDQHDGGSGRSG